MVEAFCPTRRTRRTEELTPGSWNMSQKHFNDPDTGKIPAIMVQSLSEGHGNKRLDSRSKGLHISYPDCRCTKRSSMRIGTSK